MRESPLLAADNRRDKSRGENRSPENQSASKQRRRIVGAGGNDDASRGEMRFPRRRLDWSFAESSTYARERSRQFSYFAIFRETTADDRFLGSSDRARNLFINSAAGYLRPSPSPPLPPRSSFLRLAPRPRALACPLVRWKEEFY